MPLTRQTTTVKDEYMPISVEERPMERASQRVEIISGEGEINELSFNSKRVTFNINTKTDSEVQINAVYFPGWKVKVDNQRTQLEYKNKQRLMRFKVGPGKHSVTVEFGETPIRFLAGIISLVSLFFVGRL